MTPPGFRGRASLSELPLASGSREPFGLTLGKALASSYWQLPTGSRGGRSGPGKFRRGDSWGRPENRKRNWLPFVEWREGV